MILAIYQGFPIKHTISAAVILIKFYKVNLGMTLSSDLTNNATHQTNLDISSTFLKMKKNNICNFQRPSGKSHIIFLPVLEGGGSYLGLDMETLS